VTATPIPPMDFVWHDGALRPLKPGFATSRFVDGEIYAMAPYEERSLASHNHFFAALAEAYANLPDDATIRWPTLDHFRRHGLILNGYRDEATIVCESKAAAERVAAWTRSIDSYAIVLVRDNVVIRWTAKSQSMRAMGREEFKRSKDDLLAWAAQQIGVTPDQLTKPPRDAAPANNRPARAA